jgi:cell division inhibitor SepF
MASNLFDKILDVFGMGDDMDYEDENEEMNTLETGSIEVIPNNRKGKVVSINPNSNAKVVIVEPLEFEEITTLCDCLKSKKIVIINLKSVDSRLAQRFVDFAGGAAYALDGEIQEVSPGVLLLTPVNVDVSSDLKDELSNRGIFSWTGK